MPHRAHLFSLRVSHALRETCCSSEYRFSSLLRDLISGLTVAIIAIPLSMALAIASGVAPQYGLYTAAFAGLIIALTGGSRYSVSGPTAAFVVLLFPIATQYGLAGLLLATMLSGVILMMMAYARLGRLLEYIPNSVTLGFTGGIAIVIATMQLKDLLGLSISSMPAHFISKLQLILMQLPTLSLPSACVAAVTLATLLLWPRLKLPLPAHLPAVIIASLVAYLFNQAGLNVDTIGSRFSYQLLSGETGHGIPPVLPHLMLPWLREGPNGVPLTLDLHLIIELLPSAFAIAMLGAIESLLCAVVLDGMSGTRHSANSELLGQGIGNLFAPLFGAIPATAAIARSAANLKSGAVSPLSAVIHAVAVFAAIALLAPLLSYLPMPAMAALLLMVAWNMSEAPKARQMLKHAPRSDVIVLLVCLSLTVVFDMVIAITAGVLLSAVLLMHDMARLTRVIDISPQHQAQLQPLPGDWSVYRINGPLFFAAAERIFGELSLLLEQKQGVILQLDGVTVLDAGGYSALSKLAGKTSKRGAQLYITDLQFQPLKTLRRAEFQPIPGHVELFPSLPAAFSAASGVNN